MQWVTPYTLETELASLKRELEKKYATNAYKDLKVLSLDNKFLFEVDYDFIDYDYALNYFGVHNDAIEGKCSGCRKGNFVGRNLDWSYNNDADFVIRVPRIGNRYASVGMTFKTGFTADEVRSRKYNEAYKILPFFTVDGINEFGVYCQTNVVPVADNPTPTTKTGTEGQPEISMKMICRWILDHYKSAEEAVNSLKNDYRIVTHETYTSHGFEAHWFICDSSNSYILEIVNNEVVINDVSDYPIITNFYVTGVERNADNSLFGIKDNIEGQECKAITVNKLGKYADGIERYNTINAGLANVNSKDDMFDLMAEVNYTKAYTTFDDITYAWYSENVGPDVLGYNVTNEWCKEYFDPFREMIAQMYEYRSREDGGTWQTVHQCVYDLENKKFYMKSQQNELENKIYEFEMEIK